MQEQQEVLFTSSIQFNANILQHGQGSGLGLWISSNIVQLHDGIIGVESADSSDYTKGTRFFIVLPLCKDKSFQSIKEEGSSTSTSTMYTQKRHAAGREAALSKKWSIGKSSDGLDTSRSTSSEIAEVDTDQRSGTDLRVVAIETLIGVPSLDDETCDVGGAMSASSLSAPIRRNSTTTSIGTELLKNIEERSHLAKSPKNQSDNLDSNSIVMEKLMNDLSVYGITSVTANSALSEVHAIRQVMG